MVELFLIASRLRQNEYDIELVSDELIEKFKIDKISVFSTGLGDNSNQISDLSASKSLQCDIIKIDMISTEKTDHVEGIYTLAWNSANKFIEVISSSKNAVVMVGTGSKLHDYLLWLAGTACEKEVVDIEGNVTQKFSQDYNFSSQLGPNLGSNLLDLATKSEILENYSKDWFDAEEIASVDSSVRKSGVKTAIRPLINSGLVETQNKDDSVSYRLTSDGLLFALHHQQTNIETNVEDSKKKVLVTFDRLVPSESELPFNLVNRLSKFEPMDAIFVILQRYDDKINFSGIINLSTALENEMFSDLHNEMYKYKNYIKTRSLIEGIQFIEPIIVINPNTDEIVKQFYHNVIISLKKFEFEDNNYKCNFDITSCLSKLSSMVFSLSHASNSNISYVLKSRLTEGNSSPFSLSDHVIDMPSFDVLRALKGYPKKISNRLKNMLLVFWFSEKERQEIKSETIDDFLLDREMIEINDKGLTKSDLNIHSKELADRLGYEFTLDAHPTRHLQALENNDLIYRQKGVNPSRYKLTTMGQFVANFFMNQEEFND